MSVLRRQRRVSLHLQRGQLKSETSLWNVYVQISSAPHTSHRTHSMPLTKLYIYSSVDGRWALFSRCVYLTYRKRKKTRIYWSTMWPPGDKQGKCRSSAEVFFFFFFFCSFSLLLSAVLSFCSHTVWAFHCEVCSWFKEDTAHWSCIQRLQNSIWRGRWFTMLVRLISQWVKSFSVCMVLYVYGPNYDLAVRSSLLERAWRQIHQGQETDSHCDHLPLQGQILGLVKLWLWGSEHWKTVFVQNTLATLKTLHDLKTP